MPSRRRKSGRPPKFNPAAAAAIVKAIRAGNTRAVAAACAGVRRSTFNRWLRAGRREKSGPFRDFWDRVKKADAQAVAVTVAVVRRAAMRRTETVAKRTTLPDGTTKEEVTTRRVFEWQAAAWWLERRFPETYGRDRQEIRELRKRLEELEALTRGPAAAADPAGGGGPTAGGDGGTGGGPGAAPVP